MTAIRLDPVTLRRTLETVTQLPFQMRAKYLREALNAGGGTLRNFATSMAPRETKTLIKSIKVKVVIPDTSHNRAHHGKPAYIVVGPKRRHGRMAIYSRGKLRAKSQQGAEKERLLKDKKIYLRVPSRYAHLAGPGRKSTFLQRASQLGGGMVMTRIQHKLTQAVNNFAQSQRIANGVY